MSGRLTAQDYRDLAMSALPRAIDADTAEPNLRTLFTPDSHRLALDPDVTIVRGSRGAGKTVWFKVLQDPELRSVASQAYALGRLRNVSVIPGFGSEVSPDAYPGPVVLKSLLGSFSPLEIWATVVAKALAPEEFLDSQGWADRARRLKSDPELFDVLLSRADRAAGEARQTRLVLFDALDRLATERKVADQLASGILRLALDLRARTRNLRAKVLIRPDMFSPENLGFPDSSKLISNAADLTWSEVNLYGLWFHHLGNAEHLLSKRFREAWPTWAEDEVGSLRFLAPSGLTGDARQQQPVVVDIAGPYMGTNHRKGHTYTWLPNHLMDGMGQVSPRSFLRALGQAVELTQQQYAGHVFAIHYDGIRRGVQEASRVRVAEVAEDLPWVSLAIGDLAGMQVPAERAAIVERWTDRSLADRLAPGDVDTDERVRTGPRDVDNYENLIDELVELGIMTRRANGRIDLPDVYRIAFDIGRKGGVPKLKAPLG